MQACHQFATMSKGREGPTRSLVYRSMSRNAAEIPHAPHPNRYQSKRHQHLPEKSSAKRNAIMCETSKPRPEATSNARQASSEDRQGRAVIYFKYSDRIQHRHFGYIFHNQINLTAECSPQWHMIKLVVSQPLIASACYFDASPILANPTCLQCLHESQPFCHA